MNLISASIHRPIAVIAVVIMVILFGWVARQRIPIQLAPDVRQPVIIVDIGPRRVAAAPFAEFLKCFCIRKRVGILHI